MAPREGMHRLLGPWRPWLVAVLLAWLPATWSLADGDSVEPAKAAIRVRDYGTALRTLDAAARREQASREGLQAAQLALDGVRAEYEYGLRSTLDILLAEQSYRSAQLALARAHSDVLIAQAALLRATGKLDGRAY